MNNLTKLSLQFISIGLITNSYLLLPNRTKAQDTNATYGSIAVSGSTGLVGMSWGYNTPQEAGNIAVEYCGTTDCQYSTSNAENVFGAYAVSSDRAWGIGWYKTREEAINNTISLCKQQATDPNSCDVYLLLHKDNILYNGLGSLSEVQTAPEVYTTPEEPQRDGYLFDRYSDGTCTTYANGCDD